MNISTTWKTEKFNFLEESTSNLARLTLEMFVKTQQYCQNNLAQLREEIVNKLEPEVNELEDKLSMLYIQFLATEKPVVKMLRSVVMFIKMSAELERVADLCKGITLSCERCYQHKGFQCGKYISPMFAMTKEMLELAINCFENKNEGEAHTLSTLDKQLNAKRFEIASSTLKRISNNPENSTCEYEILVMAQKLERIGDLCKNIAEETIYMESGETKPY